MGFIQVPQRKRIIRKLARTKRLERIKREHREWLESQGLSRSQLEKKSKGSPIPFPEYKPKRKMPKTSDRISKISGRAEPQHYSGERKLIGIGMLHKSNLVPVFDQQDAIDISKMRRN